MRPEDRGQHLIAYVQTSKLTDWKRLSLRHRRDTGRQVFVYRSNDDRDFATYAVPCAVLWVIESHPDGPPSLAARFDVVGQICAEADLRNLQSIGRAAVSMDLLRSFEFGRNARRWYAVGSSRTSRFFGYNDISKALLATEVKGQRWEPGETEWRSDFGRTFLRPRRVLAGHDQLIDAARRFEARSVFISWKHRDLGREMLNGLREFVHALAAEGLDCWWDQRALPRSRALDRLRQNPELLGLVLHDGLERARCLIAVGSAHYGQPSSLHPSDNWTLGEWRRVRRRMTWEGWGTPEGGWPRGRHTPLPATLDVAEVAAAVATRCDATAEPAIS